MIQASKFVNVWTFRIMIALVIAGFVMNIGAQVFAFPGIRDVNTVLLLLLLGDGVLAGMAYSIFLYKRSQLQ